MKEKSRTKNVTINASFGIFSQVIKVIIDFILRTIFIRQLGTEYLGINGLFTNVLTILSFAELGIGNAIIFNMYKEISRNNTEKIKSLMQLYKKTYMGIGCFVLLVGLVITPFIKYTISDIPNIKENLYLIYILFLLNTVVSYFFTYKKAIIIAHQKEYILNINKLITEILRVIFQIIILIFTNSFILYLLIQIFITILENIISSRKADKMFPYLSEKKVTQIAKKEKKDIFNNVKSLVMYKFGSIILNGTDNIIISKMLGLMTVGLVSNYTLLINTIIMIIASALNGFTASVGNLNASDNLEKQEKIFNQMFMISVWIYGFCSIAFMLLASDFITLWLGNSYKITMLSVFAMALHLYINGVQFAGYTYRVTLGLFNKGKFCPIIASILNIILSIVFCYKIVLAGVLLATSISRLVTTTWYDIYMVYKFRLNKSPLKFYLKYLYHFIMVLSVGLLCYKITSFINVLNISKFILKIILCIIIPNLLFLLFFIKTYEFKEILNKFKMMLRR